MLPTNKYNFKVSIVGVPIFKLTVPCSESFLALPLGLVFTALFLGLRALVAHPSPGENCKRTSERSPSCSGGDTKANPVLTLNREKIFWMRHSTDAWLSVGDAVGNGGCIVCGAPVDSSVSPGGGRNN